MRIGDLVECINGDGFGGIETGGTYRVKRVAADGDVALKAVVSRKNPTSNYLYPKDCFKLVSEEERVSVTVAGVVTARGGGAVTVKMEDGSTAMIPEKLAPIDPDIPALREFFARFVETGVSDHAWAKNLRDGLGDDAIRKLLPYFKELKRK